MRRAVGHPIAPPSAYVAVARLNLYDKIGPGPHKCHWCGDRIDWMVGAGPRTGAVIADHLDWNTADDSAANLVPACTQCNSHRTEKGDRRRIRDDEPFVVLSNGLRARTVERECEWCGTKFFVLPAQIRKGRGRFCTYECGRLGMNSRKNW